MFRGDRVGDVLQDRGLTGLRRRHDQRALPLADRHDQVDDAGGQLLGGGLQAQPLVRVQRGELAELGTLLGVLDRPPLTVSRRTSGLNFCRWLGCSPSCGHADRAGDGVAAAQAVLAHHVHRHVDVVGAGQVAGGPDERVVVEHVEDARDGLNDVVLAQFGIAVAAAALAAAPFAATPAVTEPAATPALTAFAVVVGAVVAAPVSGRPGSPPLLGWSPPCRRCRCCRLCFGACRPCVLSVSSALFSVWARRWPCVLACLPPPVRRPRERRRGARGAAGRPARRLGVLGRGTRCVSTGAPDRRVRPGRWRRLGVPAAAGGRCAVGLAAALTDGGDQFALAHPGRALDADLLGQRAQFGQHHGRQRAAAVARRDVGRRRRPRRTAIRRV